MIEITSAMLTCLLLYTGINKLKDIESFQSVLSASWVIRSFVIELSYLLPLAELLTAFLLFFPSTRLMGLWMALALLTMFTIYIGLMLLYSSKLPCSCGGAINRLSWRQHLIFNIIFVILPAVSIRLYKKNALLQ